MLRLRTARPEDLPLLRRVAFEAAFWRPETARPRLETALAKPELARYVEGFGRPGDFGIVAEENGHPLGAAWWRSFRADSPGYGFVDEATPEISIAVLPDYRGAGIGTALLQAIECAGRERGIGRLSLSVERDNPAAALYGRRGFEVVREERNALTMAIELVEPPGS